MEQWLFLLDLSSNGSTFFSLFFFLGRPLVLATL